MRQNVKKIFAVIGDPVVHSLSPVMHNAAFRAAGKNAEYLAVRVAPEHLPAFVREARTYLTGFNVTIPHKKAVAPLLDSLSGRAELCGSVNTVRVDEETGTASGDTTDGPGFERAVREGFALSLKNADLCFIGCGGVVRALAFHCAAAGVRSLRILNRTPGKAAELLHALREHFPHLLCGEALLFAKDRAAEFLNSSTLAIQCTSLGLHEHDPLPLAPELFPGKILYFDAICRKTPLLRALEKRGISTQNGAGMLLHQGALSYEIWFGEVPPLDAMRTALLNALPPE